MEHCNVKAGLSFRTRKKKSSKKKTQGHLTLKLKLPKNSRKLWENSIYQNFFRITVGFSRKFQDFFANSRGFPKTQGFSKYIQGFPQILDLPEIFSPKKCETTSETLQNHMRSLNIKWDGTSKCSLGLDWDPKTKIHQCSVVRQKMFAGWGKKGENLEGVN